MIKFIKNVFGYSTNKEDIEMESETDKEIRDLERSIDLKINKYKSYAKSEEYESADKLEYSIFEDIYRLQYLRREISYWKYMFNVDVMDNKYYKKYGENRLQRY